MRKLILGTIAGLFACAAISLPAATIINEIRTDQTGSDNDEYFELMGTPGASLDGLTYLVIGDGTGGSGVIESVTSLDGNTIAGSGFWLAAESTFTLGPTPDFVPAGSNPLNFENSDNVTHLLVSGFSGSLNDDLDTDDNGTLDAMPWTGVLDSVGLLEETNIPPTATEYAYATQLGGPNVGPDGAFVPGHVYRDPNTLEWQIGAFDPASADDTPGAANVVPEPSSVAFALAGAALGFLWLRRKH